ncbi:DUF3540 domain-containing protein [Bordetella sp. 02P26C-1]|uniref:DUF3540 domain-containing protein n=1 Tax=Bordetella sp. 02P26C-1 TaxID=2683195 RepID=UPI001355C80B|nr:DUF3540 domain-containing protein [Bordetella sp. 02P26C-1]MVW78018.1 DUF3540 domain-containing protein [Bordetella sp. 02P26C-1]
MKHAAKRQYPAYDPVHLIGTVTQRGEAGAYVVECDGRPWTARRAASCLLTPQLGDQVMISGPDASRVYLIAVVEQAEPAHSALETAGDMVLRAGSGNLTLEAPQALRLNGKEEVTVETPSLRLQAQAADFTANTLTYIGNEVAATVGSTRLVGKVYEAVMDRLSLLSRITFRVAEEVEHVRTGSLDYRADKSARVHGAYTMITADKLVKVDGKQIHMG